MFHDGDLQSGISRAIAENKLVACFVRSSSSPSSSSDDHDESRTWQEEWLPRIPQLDAKVVLLRIEFGSREASFLNAFCPITRAPTLVVIDKGRVLEKVEGGVESEVFERRVRRVLGVEVGEEVGDGEELVDEERELQEAIAQSQEEDGTSSTTRSHPEAATASDLIPVETPSQPSTTQNPPPTTSSQRDLSSMFPDRASRHEEEKARREAAEKAERIARANARRKEAEEAHEHHKGKGKSTEAAEKEKARRDWIVQQKNRKDEAKREKERILAQIEADKRDRRARSQQAKEEATAAAATSHASSPLPPSSEAASRRTMGAGGTCSLVIRLFDGSSIKNRFEPRTTLATGVRDWISSVTSTSPENRDIPYTFKQILAPLPSRSITISEENESLASLGLAPTATLVLVPVQGYTDAYSSAGGRGYMSTALHAAYNVVDTASNAADYVLSFLPGFGGSAAATEHAAAGATPTVGPVDGGASGSIKVRSLADQRRRDGEDKTEFYNGNSSAFEGRKGDGDDDQGEAGT